MPYTIKKSNGETVVVIPDGAIDEASTSLNLVGKNVSGYGFYQNENFLYLLENFAKETPPEEPIPGQLWYDITVKQLKVYTKYQSGVNGQTPVYSYFWKGVSNNTVSATPPPTADAVLGDLWYNTNSKQLNVFNGSIFEIVGTSVPGYGKSRLEGAVVQGTPHGGGPASNFPVLNLFLDNALIAIISKDGFAPTTTINGLHNNSNPANHNEITPGINFIGPALVNGRADQAHTLIDPVEGPLGAPSFVRTDAGVEQHIDSDLHTSGSVFAGNYNNSNSQIIEIGNYHGDDGNEQADAQITASGHRLFFSLNTVNGSKDILVMDGNVDEPSPRINLSPVGLRQVDLGTSVNPFRNVRASNFIGNLSATDITASGSIAGNVNSSSVRLDSLYTRNGITKIIDAAVSPARFTGRFVGVHEGEFNGTSLTLSGSANIAGAVTASSLTITGGGSASGMNINGATITSSTVSNSIVDNSTISNPTMTGTPVAPTAPVATDNQQLATTAFVHNILPQGVIVMWSGSSSNIPTGWLLCDGQTINNVTTPNLTNKFILGAGGSGPVPNTSGGSFTLNGTTQSGGSHSHTGTARGTALTVEQMPAHSHTFSDIYGGRDDAGNDFDAFSNFDYDNDTGALRIGSVTNSAGSGQAHSHVLDIDSENAHTHTVTITNAKPPYYALCYIMKAV
jgi:hypothetical protein